MNAYYYGSSARMFDHSVLIGTMQAARNRLANSSYCDVLVMKNPVLGFIFDNKDKVKKDEELYKAILVLAEGFINEEVTEDDTGGATHYRFISNSAYWSYGVTNPNEIITNVIGDVLFYKHKQ